MRRDSRSARSGPAALLAVLACVTLVTACGNAGVSPSASTAGEHPTMVAVQGKRVAAVEVPGNGHRLLLTRQVHPRGGFQYHLYTEVSGGQVELTNADHNPIVPFVATDTSPTTLVSADCVPGGIAVTEAEPAHDSGAGSWDVYRTSYRLDGTQAIPLRRRTVHTGLADSRLRSELADLHDGRMFPSCRER